MKEVVLLGYLQKNLLTVHCEQITTRWEYLRLLSLMETANNGSSFARKLLLDAATPWFLLKLCMDQPMQLLLQKLREITSLLQPLKLQAEFDTECKEAVLKKYTSSLK